MIDAIYSLSGDATVRQAVDDACWGCGHDLWPSSGSPFHQSDPELSVTAELLSHDHEGDNVLNCFSVG